MREHKLPQATIAHLVGADRRIFSGALLERFTGRDAFMEHLTKLGLPSLKVHPDPVQIATEGALWGSIAEQGLLDGTVIVSDGTGQFKIAEQALCWVHAERLGVKEARKLCLANGLEGDYLRQTGARVAPLIGLARIFLDHRRLLVAGHCL